MEGCGGPWVKNSDVWVVGKVFLECCFLMHIWIAGLYISFGGGGG